METETVKYESFKKLPKTVFVYEFDDKTVAININASKEDLVRVAGALLRDMEYYRAEAEDRGYRRCHPFHENRKPSTWRRKFLAILHVLRMP
jgi:hypothetical protein